MSGSRATPVDPAENEAHNGTTSSHENSQPGSRGGRLGDKKKRVGFTSGEDSNDRSRRGSYVGQDDGTTTPPPQLVLNSVDDEDDHDHTPAHSRRGSMEEPMTRSISKSHLPELTLQQTREIHQAFAHASIPKPAIRRTRSSPGEEGGGYSDNDDILVKAPYDDREREHRETRMREAYESGKRFEDTQRSRYDGAGYEDGPSQYDARSEGSAPSDQGSDSEEEMPIMRRTKTRSAHEAEKVIRRHTRKHLDSGDVSALPSGATTPTEEQNYAMDYQPRPEKYRGGLLGGMLRLMENDDEHLGRHSISRLLPRLPRSQPGSRPGSPEDSRRNSAASTPASSPPESGTTTPGGHHWFSRRDKHLSAPSLSRLVGSTASLSSPMVSGLGERVTERLREQKEHEARPTIEWRNSSNIALNKLSKVTGHQRRKAEDIRIKKHISETINRQKYLIQLCKGLMQYGAPTHRLEEYMRMSARVLEIDAQFLYIPGSMIVSFDDRSTHTTEVKLIRQTQGLALGKLQDVHEVYKDVVHDRTDVKDAASRLREVTSKKDKHSRWVRIPIYGLAAASVGPFAFAARLIDLPIIFILGCILGVLQLVIAPRSDLYANVFEVSATVITSFLSRAFGSIWWGDKRMFCFSAMAQSSIALILPGFIVLTASLELQSRSLVAGSVRMVYAIIYSLFLGYGITIGSTIYGIMDDNASSETTCPDPLPAKWNFLFVPIFALCLTIINQAKWKQAPAMIIIALIGYVVNFFSSRRFVGNTQISNTLGALAIGVLANTYARMAGPVENCILDRWEGNLRFKWRRIRRAFSPSKVKVKDEKDVEDGTKPDDASGYQPQIRKVGYGLAVASMLPAIFVQVPSGLAANGSLVAGIASANQIVSGGKGGTTTASTGSDSVTNSIAFTVSYSVVQVAIGITVGLFLSAIVVYPFGKRRSGLFSL